MGGIPGRVGSMSKGVGVEEQSMQGRTSSILRYNMRCKDKARSSTTFCRILLDMLKIETFLFSDGQLLEDFSARK